MSENLIHSLAESRKVAAERFTDWLDTEVIPAIRKTGGYSLAIRDACSC